MGYYPFDHDRSSPRGKDGYEEDDDDAQKPETKPGCWSDLIWLLGVFVIAAFVIGKVMGIW